MKKVFVAIVLTLGFATMASAQATRTWVSGVGDDVNPCSRTAPCKTFAGAISKTASPGIINCLDPAGYGAVTITKTIEIDCHQTLGSILHSGVQGVIVNATTNDTIILRGLSIDGSGTTIGTNGVNIFQAKAVYIEWCTIKLDSQNCVRVQNTSNGIPVHVRHSDIRMATTAGILANPTGTGSVGLDVQESTFSQNGTGVDLGANSAVTLTRCVVSNNSAGVTVEATSSSGALEGNTIIGQSGNGVNVGTGGGTPTVRFARNMITGNLGAGVTGTGTSRCFGSNVIEGNVGGGNTCTNNNVAQQ